MITFPFILFSAFFFFFIACSHHWWLAGPLSHPSIRARHPRLPCAALTSGPGEGLFLRAAGAVCGAEPTPPLRLRPPASLPRFCSQLHASASPSLNPAAGGRVGLR